MPYIKKCERPEFDEVVEMFQEDKTKEKLNTILNYIASLYDKYDSDGCLNYLFTQLIRKNEGSVEIALFIDLIIDKIIFIDGERYENYQRASGLLYRMKKEFERRKWADSAHVIDTLIGITDRSCNDYENKKIVENSDIE